MFVIAEEQRPPLTAMSFGAFVAFPAASACAFGFAVLLQRGVGMFSQRSLGDFVATPFFLGVWALFGLGGFFLDLSTPRPIP